nr:alpha/beta hydrolase [Mycobacterium lepraemurium]
MTAPSEVSGPQSSVRVHDVLKARRARIRKFAISDGAPVEVLESGPSVAARLANLTSRLTIRPILAVGSHAPDPPWPWGLIDLTARVLPADGTRRVVVYLHGGAFLTCGANSHGRLAEALSTFADAPVLVVNYRLLPKNSVGMALQDCHDAYQWLRLRGYQPDQIVLAGDSAGGYLALTLAQRLQREGEEPAALVMISPLLQLAKEPKQAHPNIDTDAMFGAGAFDALAELVAGAAAKNIVDGKPEEIYEPLEHIEPGLPRTLIHVSGSEVLLHDARLAASRLAAAGVPAEVRVWPGQIHDFQLAAPMVPEARRSLRQIGDYIREATG